MLEHLLKKFMFQGQAWFLLFLIRVISLTYIHLHHHSTIGKISHKHCAVIQGTIGEKRWKGKKEGNQAQSPGYLHLQELHTANWCLVPVGGRTILPVWWQGITIEPSALSTSSEASLLSKHITYSITAVSHGSVILPSLVNPNSLCDNSRSSLKTVVRRYVRGISNRFPSDE